MNILFVLPELIRMTGAERLVQTLSSSLVSRGHHVLVISLRHVDVGVRGEFQCSVIEVPKTFWHRRVFTDKASLIRRLNRYLSSQQTKFDLILSNVYATQSILNNPPCLFYILHNDFRGEIAMMESPQRFIRKKTDELSRYFNNRNVISVSSQSGQNLAHFFKVNPRFLTYIYNSVDIQRVRELASEQNSLIPQQPYVLFAGRNATQKGIHVLLDAFKSIYNQTDIHFCFLSDNLESLQKELEQRGITQRTYLVPFQKNPYPFMKKAKLFVLSSFYEALPTTIIEALACGTPVVSTDCHSGPREIMTHGLDQWLTPVGDADALGEKILEALNTTIVIPETLFTLFDPTVVTEQYERLAVVSQT